MRPAGRYGRRAALATLILVAAATMAAAQQQPPVELPSGLIDPSLSLPPVEAARGTAPAASESRPLDSVRGQLRPRRQTVLGAGLPGRIESFPVEVGDIVAANAPLVTMDCAVLEADRRTAQARQSAATARYTVNNKLADANNISGLEVDLSRAEMAVARAEEQRIAARMRHCRIVAPFAGVVVGKSAQAFQYVAEGEPLLHLVDNSDLLVDAAVPSTWLSDVTVGRRFTMHIDELDIDVSGRIDGTEGRVDPVSQTVRLIGSLTNPPKNLLAGMSGPIDLAVEPTQ
ncbi:efflux RND transporter periplasmic adaptor subunit [Oceanibaculum pacificum]|uniref:Uncharacterized protein n=1 Tax=Oceanibaculum pacificum TaxID=580166 RepID=A0A154VBR9_9PROT|nr:efflux RND transporter periplasmic adaptor subunit [Oceanibaculum pacificum]KZC98820.1 hypothetical protein AUP43_14725 [Oceanibaculum pacificum]